MPRNTASKPFFRSSSTWTSLPTTESSSKVTPRLLTYSTSDRTISLGRRNSGIPYIRTPPASWSASKTVTWWPILARSAAAVIPAGPAPTTATLFPLGGLADERDPSGRAFFDSQSATNLSRRPMAMGAPFFPRTHRLSHWTSWGQTRPHIPGRLFLALIVETASTISPSRTALIKAGISIPTGQPSIHLGFLHWRHLSASSAA